MNVFNQSITTFYYPEIYPISGHRSKNQIEKLKYRIKQIESDFKIPKRFE